MFLLCLKSNIFSGVTSHLNKTCTPNWKPDFNGKKTTIFWDTTFYYFILQKMFVSQVVLAMQRRTNLHAQQIILDDCLS